MRVFILAALLTVTACAAKDDMDAYNRANARADAAFAELDAEIAGGKKENISVQPEKPAEEPSPSPAPQVEEKKNPLAVSAKARPGNQQNYPMQDGKPVWVNNPGYSGRFGGIGYAAATPDYYAQKRVALSAALADLSKNVNVLIYNEVSTERILIDSASVQSYKEHYSSLSRQDVRDHISRYEELAEWKDAAGGLYVWIALAELQH